MKLQSSALALVVSIALIALLPYAATAQSVEQSNWFGLAHNIPPLNYPSCFALDGYAYCVGGGVNSSSASIIFANGTIGPWYALPGYPENETNQICAYYANNSYIACVGGYAHNPPGNVPISNASNAGYPPALGPQIGIYVSQAYASGTLGGWGIGGVYPFTPFLNSCAAAVGNIYCIGGYNLTTSNEVNGTRISGQLYVVSNTIYNSTLTSSVYYAQLGVPGGLSALNETAAYPIPVAAESCVASESYVYCIGGVTSNGNTNAVYYAKIQPNGTLGKWAATTGYPFSVNSQSCVFVKYVVLCVGGLIGKNNNTAQGTFYADVMPDGSLGQWTSLADYPLYISGESCTPYNSTVYCFGGFSRGQDSVTNASYALKIVFIPTSNSSVSTTIQNTTTVHQNITVNASTSVALTTIPTVTVGPGKGPTTTIIQQSAGGSGNYLLLVLAVIIVVLIAAYLYMKKSKKGAQGKHIQQNTS